MEHTQVFLESLLKNHESFVNGDKTLNSLIDSISCYESAIPEFFSKTGEAEGVKAMYAGIRKSLDNEKTISCIDLNNTYNIYNEYVEGMSSFISDISELAAMESTTDLSKVKANFEKAKSSDSIFIESLYDGKLKENEKSEMPLSEAVTNVEFLIDFIPLLSSLKEKCTTLTESVNNTGENECSQLLNDSLVMLFESVDNYCYKTISQIVSTYSEINDRLFNESTETKVEIPMYQLF